MNRENFESDGEMYLFWYFDELKKAGFVKEIILQPKAFNLSRSLTSNYEKQLKTKSKLVSEEIMKGHIYTTDFKIIWDHSALNLFTCCLDSNIRKKEKSSLKFIICNLSDSNELYSYIEAKPSFDQNNMTRLAKLNQKWVFDKYGEFVDIIIPEKHFNKTFTPFNYFYTNKSGKNRKINYKNVITLQEFFKKNNMIEGFKNEDDDILYKLF